MDTVEQEHPSPFYKLVDGGTDALLVYPVDEDEGPFWDEKGRLDLERCRGWDDEDVKVIHLRGSRYRLAMKSLGPFSSLRLNWGDEFHAEPQSNGTLQLVSVVVPKPFTHFSFITQSGFNNDTDLAAWVHEMCGGWETVAGGMLAVTVPSDRGDELAVLMGGIERCASIRS